MKASLPYKFITSVKNGKQYVVFDYKDSEGNRKRKWVNTDLPEKCTKKALKEAVDQIVAEFDEQFRTGTIKKRKTAPAPVAVNMPYAVMADTPEAKMKMGDYVNEWLTAMRPNLARTTYQTYKSANRRFVEYLDIHYPGITLGELRHNHVQEFLNHKLDEGCKGSAVKQYYLAIHSGLAYAVKMEYLTMHPMDKLVMPRADKYEATFYNKDELNNLFEVFKGDRLELVVHIAAYYGLRRSEVLGLRWDAIDFTNTTISIQRKVVSDYDENGKRKLFVETRLKTNSTRRTLPLIPHIERMLLEKKELEAHFKKICGSSYDKEFEGFICRDNYGKLISPEYVTSRFHYVKPATMITITAVNAVEESFTTIILIGMVTILTVIVVTMNSMMKLRSTAISLSLFSMATVNAILALNLKLTAAVKTTIMLRLSRELQTQDMSISTSKVMVA